MYRQWFGFIPLACPSNHQVTFLLASQCSFSHLANTGLLTTASPVQEAGMQLLGFDFFLIFVSVVYGSSALGAWLKSFQ